jgi:hypothetical protein
MVEATLSGETIKLLYQTFASPPADAPLNGGYWANLCDIKQIILNFFARILYLETEE